MSDDRSNLSVLKTMLDPIHYPDAIFASLDSQSDCRQSIKIEQTITTVAPNILNATANNLTVGAIGTIKGAYLWSVLRGAGCLDRIGILPRNHTVWFDGSQQPPNGSGQIPVTIDSLYFYSKYETPLTFNINEQPKIDPDLATDFTFVRAAAGYFSLISNTISTTNVNLGGKILTSSVADIRDVLQDKADGTCLSASKLQTMSITKKDARDIPISLGAVCVGGSDVGLQYTFADENLRVDTMSNGILALGNWDLATQNNPSLLVAFQLNGNRTEKMSNWLALMSDNGNPAPSTTPAGLYWTMSDNWLSPWGWSFGQFDYYPLPTNSPGSQTFPFNRSNFDLPTAGPYTRISYKFNAAVQYALHADSNFANQSTANWDEHATFCVKCHDFYFALDSTGTPRIAKTVAVEYAFPAAQSLYDVTTGGFMNTVWVNPSDPTKTYGETWANDGMLGKNRFTGCHVPLEKPEPGLWYAGTFMSLGLRVNGQTVIFTTTNPVDTATMGPPTPTNITVAGGSIFAITPVYDGFANPGECGPFRIMRYQDTSPGQVLDLDGKFFYQCIAGGKLAQFIQPSAMSVRATQADLDILSIASLLFNGPSSLFLRCYSFADLQWIHDKLQALHVGSVRGSSNWLDEIPDEAYKAMEAGGFFDTLKSFGEGIVNTARNVIDNPLTTAVYNATKPFVREMVKTVPVVGGIASQLMGAQGEYAMQSEYATPAQSNVVAAARFGRTAGMYEPSTSAGMFAPSTSAGMYAPTASASYRKRNR